MNLLTAEEVKEGIKDLDVSEEVWMTTLCLVLLEKKYHVDKQGWSILAEKARKWLEKQERKVEDKVAFKFLGERKLVYYPL